MDADEVIQETEYCTHPVRIYDEASWPLLKWHCIKCQRTGFTHDDSLFDVVKEMMKQLEDS